MFTRRAEPGAHPHVAPLMLAGTGGIALRGELSDADAPGAPLVLVHGLASNAAMWRGTARELGALGHPTLALDLRGHGRSEHPATGYDMETFIADLHAALQALAAQAGERWRRPVVAGQSMGGNLVLELAARHTEDVAGLACVDGGMIELSERFSDWQDCERELAPPDLSTRTPAELRAMLRAGSPDWPEEGIDGMMACFDVSPEGTVRPHLTRERHMLLLRSLWEHPASRLFADVSVGVLLLPAEGGGPTAFTADKRRDIERALDRLPRGRAHWFSPADHDIHAQHPRPLAQVLHDTVADGFFA